MPSKIQSSRPIELQELSKDEKRAAFEQLLNDPDKRSQFVSVLSNDDTFNQFLEYIKADPETVEVLTDLRKQHQIKINYELPNKEPIITFESGEVPKFKPARFKKIRANVDEPDTIQSQIKR